MNNNKHFINNMPIGARDCEDGGMEGMDETDAQATAKAYAASREAMKQKSYLAARAAENALGARRCKEVEARAKAMTAKLGRPVKNAEMDTIRWQVGKEIK